MVMSTANSPYLIGPKLATGTSMQCVREFVRILSILMCRSPDPRGRTDSRFFSCTASTEAMYSI